jgi:hypothetical protein
MSSDRRNHKRWLLNSCFSEIFSLAGQRICDCKIVDLSTSGARIAISGMPEVVPDYFKLLLDGVLSKCRVRWRSKSELGVQFYR